MNRAEARERVWRALRRVARPDSRFHFNFNEFIPDFEGSLEATERLAALEAYRRARTVFITPDNCLEALRARAVRDGKVQIVSTYGIRRGFVELRPEDVPEGLEAYAVLLDVMEKVGRPVSLRELRDGYRIDLLVTGASVVSRNGVRFGKGHGYFDLEWAMLYQIGAVDRYTPVIAFVHDCQVVDLALDPSPFDTVCDLIVTPTGVLEVADPQKPEVGVLWDRLEPGMLEEIPLLQELWHMEQEGRPKQGAERR